ncbi:MAG: GNAT family N-acetyltransferase [Desulfobacterales bacterium]|jgi:hypothetical protein
MEIKAYTVADLKTALLSADFWRSKTLPITKPRAISFIQNPRAGKDDPVLLVAYQDDRVIGYLGILPDKIFVDKAAYKLGWLTSWWVEPACANTGVGAILLFKALNAYRQRLGLSGGSSEARKVLDASGKFAALKPLKGLDIKFRFNVTGAILRKRPALRIFRIVFKILDAIMDETVDLRNFFWKQRRDICQGLTFEYISSIDDETGRFIQRHQQYDLTKKGKSDLNWILKYPWVISAPEKDSAGRRYYFSSCARRFFYMGVKVIGRDSQLVGFFMLKVRDDRMSITYSYFESQHALSMTAAVVYQALAMEVGSLSLFDEQLVASFPELGCPCWSVKKISRGFSLSNALTDVPLTNYRLHGGDGDLAFY